MNLTSNEPFWLLKNGLLNSYPSLSQNLKTDVLIIGAGITGSLIAHQCIQDGFQVILIDKREVANGSTSASTCMLQYEIDVSLVQLIQQIGEEGAVASYKACAESIDKLKDLVNLISSPCGFQKKQSLYMAAHAKDVHWMKEEFESRQKNGFEVSWMQASEIQRDFGFLNVYGGILSKQAASFDAFRFTHDLIHYHVSKGRLQLFDKTWIQNIRHHHEGVLTTTQNGYQIESKKIIFCTGFEATNMIAEKLVKLLTTYAVVGEQREHAYSQLKNLLFWDSSSPYHYGRLTDDGRLLVGGEDQETKTPRKKLSIMGKKAQKLGDYIQNQLPDYPFQLDFSWCGTFGSTKDGLPYIGKHKKFPKCYFVLGFGGNGITFSVKGMEMVSSWLKNETHPLDEYFRFGR